MNSLFGESFAIDLAKPDVKALIKKTQKTVDLNADPQALLKSKKLTLDERLSVIKTNVLKILGKQKQNTLVIRTREELDRYIDTVIAGGFCAVDTETNNSLDPITCKLMGLCLYSPGQKQAYIPVNHINNQTNSRLDNQLTEQDCRQALQRIIDANVFIIMHNGKFDYEVLKCTCGIEVKPDWDTQVAAHLIDENELSSLKHQYCTKIDPSQTKYDIEKLFENVLYAQVDPEIFALYAATDSFMTYKLFRYQEPFMRAEENKKVYWVFTNIEMPIVVVTADMELRGVKIDQAFSEKLKLRFNHELEIVDAKIGQELKQLEDKIALWRLTPQANVKSVQWAPKKSKRSMDAIEAAYPEVDEATGKRFKYGKTPSAQLESPINLASPTQLAVLFYDILKAPCVNKQKPRATGKQELQEIADRTNLPICKLLLERRGIEKLITTYVEPIPALAAHWPDGRVRAHLKSTGTNTGRYSSGGTIKFVDEQSGEPVEISGLNLQNIPSRGDGKVARLLFMGDVKYNDIESVGDCFEVAEIAEVQTIDGWKYGKDLAVGDVLVTSEGQIEIQDVFYENKKYFISV